MGDITHGDRLAAGKLITAKAKAKREGWDRWIKNAADEHALLAGCYFDERAALKVCWYFETQLVMAEERWAGKPFLLMDWQKYDVLMPMFGWKWPDGTRRFRNCWIEVAKKNGKSGLCSGITIYLADADAVQGGNVYTAGIDLPQAGIVWKGAADMVNVSPNVRERLRVIESTSRIVNYAKNAAILKISADTPESKEGFKPYAMVVDEVHAYKSRKLFDVTEYAMVSKKQWMKVFITTAGIIDQSTFYWDEHNKALAIRKGELFDDRYFQYIAAPDYERAAKHDMEYLGDPATWRTANPSLGEILSEEDFQRDFDEARKNPAKWNNFLRYRLNVPTEQSIRWIMMDKWDACGGPVDIESLKGKECYGGLDMSSTEDLTAFVLVFPRDTETVEDVDAVDVANQTGQVYEGINDSADGTQEAKVPSRLLYDYDVLVWCWVPEETAKTRQEKDSVPYIEWAKRGFLELTPGNMINHSRVRNVVLRCSQIYDIKEIAYDPWNAGQIAVELQEEGITMVEFCQKLSKFAAPTAYTEVLVNKGKLHHGDHPVLRWCASNVQVTVDSNNNKRPAKDKSKEKIDCMVATIMAVGRAMLHEGAEVSVYAKEKMLVLSR